MPRVISKLQNWHIELARQLAAGASITTAARALNRTPHFVYACIAPSPLFKAELKRQHDLRDQALVTATVAGMLGVYRERKEITPRKPGSGRKPLNKPASE